MKLKTTPTFQLGYWYINHKKTVRKIIKYICIIAIILLWVNCIFKLIIYITNISKTEEVIKDLAVNYVNYRAIKPPQDIIIIESAILGRGNGNYDIMAQIENPNKYWSAEEITYQFEINGEPLQTEQVRLLPQSQKYLTIIDKPFSNVNNITGNRVELKILNVKWKGQRKQLPPVDFSFSNTKYATVELLKDDSSINTRLTTTALNNGIYGFKKIKVTVILKNLGKPVGINILFLNDFTSKESRDIEFVWPKKFPVNSEAIFNVETDTLDDNNLIINSLQ